MRVIIGCLAMVLILISQTMLGYAQEQTNQGQLQFMIKIGNPEQMGGTRSSGTQPAAQQQAPALQKESPEKANVQESAKTTDAEQSYKKKTTEKEKTSSPPSQRWE
jgi:hypothetical protein